MLEKYFEVDPSICCFKKSVNLGKISSNTIKTLIKVFILHNSVDLKVLSFSRTSFYLTVIRNRGRSKKRTHNYTLKEI